MPADQTRTWQTATSAALWGSQTNTLMIEGGHVVVWEGGPCALFTMLRERMSVNGWCERAEELRHFEGTSRNPRRSSSQAHLFFWKEGGLHARVADNEDFGTRPSRLLGEPAPRTEAACRGLQKVNRKTVLQRGDGSGFTNAWTNLGFSPSKATSQHS